MSKSFVDILERYIESERFALPVFNAVTMRLQIELIKKEPDLQTVEKLIVADQSLSGNVLKVANSPQFQGLIETKSVHAAIVRLGMNEITQMVFLDLNSKEYKCRDRQMNVFFKKLWQHSVGCAFAAGWLSKRLDFGVMQHEAFGAGLFHDVGKLLILKVIDRRKQKEKTFRIQDELVMGAMDLLHAEQGAKLLERINMPDVFCRIARDHHKEEFDTENYLLVLTRMANLVCRKLGMGLRMDSSFDLMTTPEATILRVSEMDFAELELFLESTPSLMR